MTPITSMWQAEARPSGAAHSATPADHPWRPCKLAHSRKRSIDTDPIATAPSGLAHHSGCSCKLFAIIIKWRWVRVGNSGVQQLQVAPRESVHHGSQRHASAFVWSSGSWPSVGCAGCSDCLPELALACLAVSLQPPRFHSPRAWRHCWYATYQFPLWIFLLMKLRFMWFRKGVVVNCCELDLNEKFINNWQYYHKNFTIEILGSIQIFWVFYSICTF
jgi:hypothetical protein